MSQERERALGQVVILRNQIYQLATKSQAMVKEIHDETNSFLSDKDFTSMDFKKVGTLAIELQELQKVYEEKVNRINALVSTYNFQE